MEKPKYYRCIKSTSSSFTINRIYQIVDPDNVNAINNFIGNKGNKNGWHNNNLEYFTPVTEHEWNLQEGIITPVGKENHSQLSLILKKLHIK